MRQVAGWRCRSPGRRSGQLSSRRPSRSAPKHGAKELGHRVALLLRLLLGLGRRLLLLARRRLLWLAVRLAALGRVLVAAAVGRLHGGLARRRAVGLLVLLGWVLLLVLPLGWVLLVLRLRRRRLVVAALLAQAGGAAAAVSLRGNRSGPRNRPVQSIGKYAASTLVPARQRTCCGGGGAL